MEKIKNFFSKLGKKFKENGKKLAFWFVLLVVSVTGFFYSFRAKNNGNLVSGSADTVTNATFSSRIIDATPLLGVVGNAYLNTDHTQTLTNSFNLVMDLSGYFSLFTIEKNYTDNIITLNYSLNRHVPLNTGDFNGVVTPSVEVSKSLVFNSSSSFSVTNFAIRSGGITIQPNYEFPNTAYLGMLYVSPYAYCYQEMGSSLNPYSNPVYGSSRSYQVINNVIHEVSPFAGICYTSLGVAGSISSLDFDPQNIVKVTKRYEPLTGNSWGSYFYNLIYLNKLSFSLLSFIYTDINNNSVTFSMPVIGSYTGYNSGTSSIVDEIRYLSTGAGYSDGYNDGMEEGLKDKEQAVNNAYNQGKSEGYILGRETPTYSFISLLDAVGYSVTKPFASLLNFDLLGTNLLSLATGFISLVIIVKIIGLLI